MMAALFLKSQGTMVLVLSLIGLAMGQNFVMIWGEHTRYFGKWYPVFRDVREVFGCYSALGVLKRDRKFEIYQVNYRNTYFFLGDKVEVDYMACSENMGGVLLTNGTVVDFRQDRLVFVDGVKQLVATLDTIVALKFDGTIVSWGKLPLPKSIAKSNKLIQVASNRGAFAALSEKGSVVTWGYNSYGGQVSLKGISRNVKALFPGDTGFAALKTNGKVSAWTNAGMKRVSEVDEVQPNTNGFTFLYQNRSALAWIGDNDYFFQGPIRTITSAGRAVAALNENGSVSVMGEGMAADTSRVNLKKDIAQVVSNFATFAARANDGTVHCWGLGQGACPIFRYPVKELCATANSFLALSNGRITQWGVNQEVHHINKPGYRVTGISVSQEQFYRDSGFYVATYTQVQPTYYPSYASTPRPSTTPTRTPSSAPTNVPTNVPTNAPTNAPTFAPSTGSPTNWPSPSPASYVTTQTGGKDEFLGALALLYSVILFSCFSTAWLLCRHAQQVLAFWGCSDAVMWKESKRENARLVVELCEAQPREMDVTMGVPLDACSGTSRNGNILAELPNASVLPTAEVVEDSQQWLDIS